MAKAHLAAPNPRSYPIFVEVGYRLEHQGTVRIARGLTESISSTSVRFIVPEELPLDTPIDLSIAWPALLNGKVGLRLCVKGRIIENRDGCVSVAILKYEFRTKASIEQVALVPRREMNSARLFPVKVAFSGR